MKQSILKKIPAVNDLLASEQGINLIESFSRLMVVEGIREVTHQLREKILTAGDDELDIFAENLGAELILNKVAEYLRVKLKPELSPAINATGIVLHTNLGRSLLSQSALKAMQSIADNYSTLEIDRESGERGSRYHHVKGILLELTGAEDCLVVNNNAAAVLLALDTLARGKEAIISRGELVEIGGSFRIPDVMARSGARLVEVGTTNRVYLDDFSRAVTEETGLIMRVHTSNYKIVGFVEGVDLEELASFAHSCNLPLIEDIGSGVLLDLREEGLSHEPTVQESIKAGVDLLTFSGDKLLGGPQAGIIIGKKEYVEPMKKNPLTRALRVDKFTLAALEATLMEYRNPAEAKKRIPILQMLCISPEEIRLRAERLLEELLQVIPGDIKLKISQDFSRVGGGALPQEELPTYVIELSITGRKIEEVARRFRLNDPPIFTRLAHDAILFDLRTIREKDWPVLITAFKSIF